MRDEALANAEHHARSASVDMRHGGTERVMLHAACAIAWALLAMAAGGKDD